MAKRGRKLPISLQVPPDLWARFKLLASETGASTNFCVERVLQDAVNQGRVPGIQALEEHQSRENEKYGTATPVYAGEEPQPKQVEKPAKQPRRVSS